MFHHSTALKGTTLKRVSQKGCGREVESETRSNSLTAKPVRGRAACFIKGDRSPLEGSLQGGCESAPESHPYTSVDIYNQLVLGK